jgi:O-antigen ligase
MNEKNSFWLLSQKIADILWIIMIALLPISSMPLIARLLGSDTVAAPSIIVVFFLMVIWFIPYILRRGKMIKEGIPLLVFVIVALAATVLANFKVIPAYKDIPYLSNSIEAFVTLLIGVVFFLVTSSYLQNEEKALLTLKVINWSAIVMLIWTGFQVVAWHGFGHYPGWMFDLQGLISSRVLYRQRVNGLALEPSWFAHQLNMIYIPIWLAATIKGVSAFKKRLGFLTVESVLLVAGIGSLLLTLSRVGLLAFLLMFTFLFIKLHSHLVTKVAASIQKKKEKISSTQKKRLTVLISILFIVVYLLILAVGLYVFSKVDPRMASLFDFSVGQDNPLLAYFNELSFGERIVYWLAGWNVFAEHPILGVGLGNAGFYFPKAITPYGWNLIEVRRLAYRSSILLNVKSLWARLLAETGLVGFAVFCSWLYSLVKKFVKKSETKHNMTGVFALSGVFVLCALLAEGFSIDSFAMPYMWIALGLAAADLPLLSNKGS